MKTKFITLSLILITVISNSLFAQGKDLSYKDDTLKLKGFYAASSIKKTKKKAPGVIVIHAWMGISEHEKTTANKLSKLGYNTLVADIYGENVRPKNAQEAGATAGYYKKNYLVYQGRIKAAIKTLIEQGTDPENIVVMGYCFGGTGAIEAARAGLPVKGIVSFHGGLGKDSLREINPIKTKMLILHGAVDPFVSEKEVKKFQQEVNTANADWQMIYYANAVHAFTDPAAGNDNSKGAAYNKEADERSWKAMINFLDEVIKK